MTDTSNKNPSFFKPAKIERKHQVFNYGNRDKSQLFDDIDKRILPILDPSSHPPMPRILVTGSRDWDDVLMIRNSLLFYSQFIKGHLDWDVKLNPHYRSVPYKPILVSGNCPSGADLIAETIAEGLGWTVERYPADWYPESKGVRDRSAGPKRNQKMVNLGADICLAFNLNNSKGAKHCAEAAGAAEIFTVLHLLNDVTTEWGN